jgi:hypothetical protein
MNSDRSVDTTGERSTWVSLVASACFVEELELDSLPLSEALKVEVQRVLEGLRQLSPMEALVRCLSTPGTCSSWAI